MLEHHQRSIEKLTESFRRDPGFRALIIAGSVAKGRSLPNSDIDALMVATDEEYAKWLEHGDFCHQPEGFCDYPGGFVDGKVIDLQFIKDVDERGSEVARSAFLGAFVAYSEVDGLAALIERIAQYPRHEKEQKLQSFRAHLEAARWFMGEAEKRQDIYLINRAASHLVLFGARMILAHNEILFSYHKYLMDDLAKAPLKPADAPELALQLLKAPSMATAERFYDCIESFTDWPMPSDGWGARFMKDTEWNWRYGPAPIEDR